MSFASKVLYTGDGIIKSFNIPMPYISASHLKVFVDNILQLNPMNYSLSGASTVLFGTAPGDGSSIEIRRHTSPTAILVDFVDGSVLHANELDTAYLHNFYLGQEYSDSFNEVINNIFLQYASDFGILETETDAIINALTQEMISGDAAAELQARITDIDANAEAIITLGEGLQVQINTLASGIGSAEVYIQPTEPIPGVDGVPDPIADGARWYDSDDNNHPYIYLLATLEWVDIEDPRIGNNEAAITVLSVETGDNAAAIIAESVVRSDADIAFASELGLVGAQNGAKTAFIIDLDTAYVGPTESLATRFSQISADWGAGDDVVSAEVTTEASARATADGLIATTMSLIGAENGAKTAFILDENTVKIASDGGDTMAERFSGLAVADSDNSASITTIQTVTIPGVQTDADAAQSTADGAQTYGEGVASDLGDFESDVQAEYGVDLTVNGYVSGFRLINGGTPGQSAFVILADKFAIVDPSGDPGEAEYVPMQIVGGKVRFNANVEIHGNLVVDGTVNGIALIAGTIGSTQIGADAIFSSHIGADQIVATHIDGNVITGDHIAGTTLAAIFADLGHITAGDITMDTAGWIKGGQTAYDTGNGFFLGYGSGQYRFSIGNGSTAGMTWNGTALTVKGAIQNTNTAGDNVMMFADNANFNFNATYVLKKSFTIADSGTIRVANYVRVDDNTTGTTTTVARYQVRIGAAVKATGDVTNESYAWHTDDIAVTAGDQVDVYLRGRTFDPSSQTSACRIAGCEIRTGKTTDYVLLD